MLVFVFVKCYNRNVSFWPCKPNHLFFSSFLWQFLPIVTVLEFCFARLFPFSLLVNSVFFLLYSDLFSLKNCGKIWLWGRQKLAFILCCVYLSFRICWLIFFWREFDELGRRNLTDYFRYYFLLISRTFFFFLFRGCFSSLGDWDFLMIVFFPFL